MKKLLSDEELEQIVGGATKVVPTLNELITDGIADAKFMFKNPSSGSEFETLVQKVGLPDAIVDFYDAKILGLTLVI